MERRCLNCNKPLVGRSDKKFCDQYCKSELQYKSRKANEPFFFQIDRQLKTNRKLLKKYTAAGLARINKPQLIQEGFNPKIFTHYFKTDKGHLYLFCYEFGFRDIWYQGKEKYLLITWQDYMNPSIGAKKLDNKSKDSS